MYAKTCPSCNGVSYSAATDRDKWICPYCGRDLTAEKAWVPGPRGNGQAAAKPGGQSLDLCPACVHSQVCILSRVRATWNGLRVVTVQECAQYRAGPP